MSMLFASADSRAISTGATGLDGSVISLLVWIYPTAYDFGSIFRLDENSNALWVYMDSGNQAVSFRYYTSGTRGQWNAGGSSTPNMPVVLNAWTCYAVTFDRSSVSNDPTVYMRRLGTDADLVPTTALDEGSTPTGTFNTPNAGYALGADDTGFHEFPFVGRIYGLQVWNTALSEAQFEAASLNPGSVTSGLALYLDDSGTDLSGNGRNATLTNVSTAANPPGIPVVVGPPRGGMSLLGAGG